MEWADRIGRRLKLRDLHVFMTVAQEGGIGRAAKSLAVSRPVVSKAISDLERMLEVRLFDRTAQGVAPTFHGQALLRWSTVVFDHLKRSVREIEYLADPGAGEVRVASSEVMNASFVPVIINRLNRRYPRLVFHALHGLRADVCKLLRERRVDLAMTYLTPPFEQEDVQAEVLFSDTLSVVATSENKWVRRRRRVELAELVDEPWCLPLENTVLHSLIARAFHEKGLTTPRHFVVTNTYQMYQAMVATGRFLCFAPTARLRLTGRRSGLKAVPVVDLHAPYGDVGIVTLKDRAINPAAQLFIECARKLARPLAKA